MSGKNDLLRNSAEFVASLFANGLPYWAFYHNYDHTAATAEACEQIGKGSKLSESDLEVVCLAAWFHDTGYIETCDGHEGKSVPIASHFLEERGYPKEKVDLVASCILATKMPQCPTNMLERVICDADMVFLGRKEFFYTNNLLKREIETRENRIISTVAWLERSLAFLLSQQFHTRYARSLLGPQREANLLALQEQLQEAIVKERPWPLTQGRQSDRP